MLLEMAQALTATAAEVSGRNGRQTGSGDLLVRVAAVGLASAGRRRMIAPGLVGDPAWAILLDLYIARAAGREVRTSSLYEPSGVPDTTALRYIGWLENQGLVKREKSTEDQRVTVVALTDSAVAALDSYLEQFLADVIALVDPAAEPYSRLSEEGKS